MPSTATITSFYNFTALTKIKSAEVNANFSIFRGHILPTDPNTATAATSNTYDLGSSDHYWRNVHTKDLTLYELSTGAHAVTLKAPDSLTASYTFPLPPDMGVNGQFLKTNGSVSSWASATNNLSVVTKTANYSATASDDVILCDASAASFTIELPDAAGNNGKKLTFIKINDTNIVTIDGLGGDTLAGRTTFLLTKIYASASFISDNSNWQLESTTERVYAEYNAAAGQSLAGAAFTIMNYGTRVSDAWTCVATGASWAFTAPFTDLYQVEAMAQPSAVAAASQYTLALYKNGSVYKNLNSQRNNRAAADDQPLVGAATIELSAGDTIDLRLFVSTAQSTTAANTYNWVTISSLRGV